MPRSPDRAHRSALTDIEGRISVLERRLRNARSARDSYVDYLRGKYPHWRPSLPSYNRQQLRNEENLVSRLSTSAYHWEGSRQPTVRPPPQNSTFYHQIPPRGPFMESDFMRTRDRLGVMSQQLRVLRDARLNMTTDEYFRTRAGRVKEGSFEEEEIPTLDGVRKRLAEMSFSLMEPPSTPTQEKIDDMKRQEQREKMIQDIRAGVLPSVTNIASGPSFMPEETQPVISDMKQEELVPPPPPPQQRIQFVDNKPPASQPVKQETKGSHIHSQMLSFSAPPTQPSNTNAYSKMLSVLTKNDSTDSDDVHIPSSSSVSQPPAKVQTPKKEEPKPMLGSLSMFLQQQKTAPKAAAKKQADPDSDSDFFD